MPAAPPLSIAFVNSLYPPHGSGGAEMTLQALAEGLAARGHRCHVVTLTPHGREETGEVGGVPVTYLPLANLYWPHGARPGPLKRTLFQAIDAWNPVMGARVGRVLRRLRPEVVHCHNLRGFSVAAWQAAARLRVPVVQTLHDYWAVCPRSAMWRDGAGNCAAQCTDCRALAAPRRWLGHIPAAVTAVSHRMLDRMLAAGLAPRAVPRVIRNPNPAEPMPAAAAPEPWAAGPLRLGYLGRLHLAKGLETLFDTMGALPPGTATLTVAGSGNPDYVAGLRARAAGAEIGFLGHVPPAELFRRIDLLVVPSEWEEPGGRIVHEAFRHGIPSLVLPLGGPPEIVAHGVTGFVAPAATPAALRDAISRLAAERWDRAAMAAACREAALPFDADAILSEYEALLRAAARGLPSTGGEAHAPGRKGTPDRAALLPPTLRHSP